MNQRQCVILQGGKDWCKTASETLLADYDISQVLWLAHNAPEKSVSSSQKKAQSQLGKEFDAVVFDAIDEFNPDSLGALVGTIKQSGVLIIYVDVHSHTSLSMQRFKHVISKFENEYDHFHVIEQDQNLPTLTLPNINPTTNEVILTDDQKNAVAAISKVVHGHRRRPLVLSADRGRGKSASLGIAAAQLLNEGKQTILVTAPSLATVDTVFEHASRLLAGADTSAGLISVNGAEIRFVAPDVLIELDLKADLVLVDEAASIPASMLEKLLQKYSRIVFSTTLHGYEGTGRGFAVRFQKILNDKTPGWHHYQMETPIRWSKNDALEAFSFESLLLNASPVDDDLISDASADQCQFECIDRQSLVNHEHDLRELFGLMVLAHYRTRPSDLQMMLDRDDVSVYVIRYQGHIVASAWLVKEGELDDGLSANIHAGTRRLKGHLLPQSLLAHVGMTTAGSLNYQRIIRIAVHPAVQQRGIGRQLLTKIVDQAECDIVGTSFAVSNHLLTFWLSLSFKPVRLGLHQDDVSGSHALMMLNPISSVGKELCNAALQRFQQQWPHLLRHEFKQLDAQLVITLSQTMTQNEVILSQWEQQDIEAFAYAQRGFEFSQFSLWLWLQTNISQPEFKQLTVQQQQLCVMLIMQQCDWADIAKQLGFTGKSQCIIALREVMALLLRINKPHVEK